MGWDAKRVWSSRARLSGLLLLALPLLLAAARDSAVNKLNSAWLLPGKEFKLDGAALSGEHKFCCLTFDDGPDSKHTLAVAGILQKYGVPATFFVVGYRLENYPGQVAALAAAGHEIANHSYDHPDFTKLSRESMDRQLTRTQKLLAAEGVSPRWFRPPYGAYNKTTVKACQAAGLQPVLWSVDPRDWAEPGAGKITSRVLSGTTNGAVILLHSTHGQTVEALPAIIEGLRGKGYTFLTLSQWQQVVTGAAPADSFVFPPEDGFRPHELPELPLPPTLDPPIPGDSSELPTLPSGGAGLLADADPAPLEEAVADSPVQPPARSLGPSTGDVERLHWKSPVENPGPSELGPPGLEQAQPAGATTATTDAAAPTAEPAAVLAAEPAPDGGLRWWVRVIANFANVEGLLRVMEEAESDGLHQWK